MLNQNCFTYKNIGVIEYRSTWCYCT
jgi:hypothetical protein